jgi:purine-binding chemotaxis protein CheW
MERGAAPATVAQRPHVLFTLGGGTYAVPSDVVLQLALPGEITPVPNAPPWVEGVASIRGRVTPVVDLRARFGFAPIPIDGRSRLVVVSIGGREVALRVDGAREFATLAEDAIVPLAGASQDLGGGHVKGTTHLGERVVMVLDTESVIQS